ncbi:hypothetical protein MN116_006298 [Schistosoma mekongi]|uniref:Uncharacterized protein n=1 Tax=Schistosoma mekongi TaxID=38744 RepID=A0AAE1ZB27_SCHME|nr:hypothetical protein MN116_006298 [Schistosoma mekongi]
MNHNSIDSSTFWQPKSQWNLMQAFLLSSSFISMTMFSKYPLDQYLGSGWAFLSFIIFQIIYNTPITYLQFRVFGYFRESLLVLFDRYIPISNIIVIIINLMKFVIGTYFLSISFGYLFFTFYNCDGRNCIGGTFVWGSCSDSWSEGDCKDNYKTVHEGPIPEEKFVLNFLLERSDSILSGWEITSWFTIRGLILIPYIAAFTCIFLITIGGPKVFGILLYVLSPLAICLISGVLITIRVKYANSTNQLSDYYTKFYRMFFTMIPYNPDGVDTYHVQPLVWGFLSTFVHLSQSYNLWNGVYPTVGRLMNGGRKMRHLGWLPTVIGSALLGQLPVLIILFAISSSYDPQYVRCHLSVDWLAPFIIIPHIFSKFSSSRLLVASYFLGLSLFLLLNQALILLSTTEHIVGHLITNNEKYEDHYKRVYRCSIIFLILLLGLLGVPLVTQAGFYWIRLTDWFIDRLMLIPVLGQAVGFLTVYAHLRGNKIETPLLKTIIICIYAILITISSGIYIWYAFSSLQKPTDFQCRTYSRAPVNDPVQNNFILLGWLIAFLPILIGIIIGLILTFIRFRSRHTTKYSYFNYLFKGDYGLQKFMQNSIHSSNIQSIIPKYSNIPKTFSWTKINNYNGNQFLDTNLYYPNNHQVNRTIYRSVDEQLNHIISSNNDIIHAYSINQLPIYNEYNQSINQLSLHRKSEMNIDNRSMPMGKDYQYQKGKYHQLSHYSNHHSNNKSNIYESEEFL